MTQTTQTERKMKNITRQEKYGKGFGSNQHSLVYMAPARLLYRANLIGKEGRNYLEHGCLKLLLI